MHNGHILKMYSWQHFLAVRNNRLLAQFHWATQHKIESGK